MRHPRELAIPVEWALVYAPAAEPIAIIRRLELSNGACYRAVTGAARSSDRELIGYYDTGDEAAISAWRRYVRLAHEQHESASRVHGSDERGPRRADRSLGSALTDPQ